MANIRILGHLLLAVSCILTAAIECILCVTSTAEMNKCATFTGITCILGSDGTDCLDKIEDGTADVTSLHEGNVHKAGVCYGLKPIIVENTIGMPTGGGYYAVAVAKKSSAITIKSLAGKKSCHTAVNETAGWYIPMSVLFDSKDDLLGQASAFFCQSCAPGAVPETNMCKLCTPNCERNSNNRYYCFSGAAKCLMDTDADVAFVDHGIFLNNPQKFDYELLCRNGSTASIDDYVNCNLALIPSHAIVGRSNLTLAYIYGIFSLFTNSPYSVLFSNYFGKDLIFSESTAFLTPVYEDYIDFLRVDYLNAVPLPDC